MNCGNGVEVSDKGGVVVKDCRTQGNERYGFHLTDNAEVTVQNGSSTDEDPWFLDTNGGTLAVRNCRVGDTQPVSWVETR